MDQKSFDEQMTSFKTLFRRSFLECGECGFVFTTLGQGNYAVEGACPACGEDCDYASEGARNRFIIGVKDELEVFEEELAKE